MRGGRRDDSARTRRKILISTQVRRPFHLASLSTSRFGACGFSQKEVQAINAIAAVAVNKNKEGALLLPVRIWGPGADDRMRLAEVVAECSATHVVRLSLVWHVWGRGRVEQSFPEAELCGEVSRRVAALEPWEHVRYLDCVSDCVEINQYLSTSTPSSRCSCTASRRS